MNGIDLDTNVIAEPRRPTPDPKVRAWFEVQEIERLYLTATVIGELAAGIERVPKGRRRVDFERWLQALVVEDFGRVLAFDVKTALLYGKLVAGALRVDRRRSAMRRSQRWPALKEWRSQAGTWLISSHWACPPSIPGEMGRLARHVQPLSP
jgi:predicted nucleic acid-binding protein